MGRASCRARAAAESALLRSFRGLLARRRVRRRRRRRSARFQQGARDLGRRRGRAESTREQFRQQYRLDARRPQSRSATSAVFASGRRASSASAAASSSRPSDPQGGREADRRPPARCAAGRSQLRRTLGDGATRLLDRRPRPARADHFVAGEDRDRDRARRGRDRQAVLYPDEGRSTSATASTAAEASSATTRREPLLRLRPDRRARRACAPATRPGLQKAKPVPGGARLPRRGLSTDGDARPAVRPRRLRETEEPAA